VGLQWVQVLIVTLVFQRKLQTRSPDKQAISSQPLLINLRH
jgi:hypothetical protein